MRPILCFALLLMPLTSKAKENEIPQCYLVNEIENRSNFLMKFTDTENYYIVEKTTGKYIPTDSLSCLSELDFSTVNYTCIVTNYKILK